MVLLNTTVFKPIHCQPLLLPVDGTLVLKHVAVGM